MQPSTGGILRSVNTLAWMPDISPERLTSDGCYSDNEACHVTFFSVLNEFGSFPAPKPCLHLKPSHAADRIPSAKETRNWTQPAGMDPFSALAIAAAVVQFTEIGGKIFVRCWEEYRKLQEIGHKGYNRRERAIEEKRIKDDLKARVDRLNTLVSETQLPSIESVASQPPTPAQQQLINVASECSRIRTEVHEIATRFIIRPDSRPDTTVRRPRTLFSRSMNQEPNILPLVTKEEIEQIEKRCEFARSQAMNSILICLWENSKQTKKWEVHFSTQLSNAIGLLRNVDKKTTPSTRHQSNLGLADSCGLQSDVAMDMAKLRKAILPLVEAEGSLSMADIGTEMARALCTGMENLPLIRDELVEILWRKGWQMDMSIPGVSAAGTLPNLDAAMVGHATSTSVRFEVLDSREAAIPQAFGTTYRWILDYDPPMQGGKPSWESFPRWLIDSSSTIYWVTGKPGSGKSTMMKFLLQQPLVREYLSRELGTLRLLVARYYAWNAGKDLQKSFEGLKRTLISQVLDLDPNLAPKLTPRRWVLCQILRSTSCLPDWEPWEIDEAFKAVLSQCGTTIKLALFIDGLDEFDTPPRDVIKEIRAIASLCPTGLKICVASRPWNTFNDEYGRGPSLEMHLATYKDMVSFVTGSFKENRAFNEHQALNPQGASELVRRVVTRANGVFQWVSLVVPLLLDLLTDGESPTESVDIQQALQDLPSELETLYESIWARIKPENLHNASFMIQILRAAGRPVSWLNMWVIEDLKLASARVERSSVSVEISSEAIEQFRGDSNLKNVAKISLRRKLVGRTKGILEMNLEGDGFVDFIHRTARDWAANPKMWELICNASKDPFDPHLYLLQAETLTLTYRSRTWSNPDAQLRDAIMSAFWHASKVDFTQENNKTLVKCLTALEERGKALEGDRHSQRKTCWAPAKFSIDNNFVGLAAQFSVLPYVQFALQADVSRRLQKPSKGVLGLLENAIFGPIYYNPPAGLQGGPHPIPQKRRLATISTLKLDTLTLELEAFDTQFK
ncbi:heterokaryon incompatibility protein het-E-1 [Fusarium sp. NRRL 52700]|nr:heterokaryon incompatibility protein het-E-1 [Fusarium sp. NRRL 52700]